MGVVTAEPRAVPGRRPGLLRRHRDFRLLWFGETISRLGSRVTSVALPLAAIATLHAGTFQVALLVAASWLPWLVIGLPAGAWVDRLPPRPVLLACDAVSLLAFLSVPVAAGLGVLTIGQLLAVAVLAGTAAVFFQTAYQVFVTALLRPEQLRAGNAVLQGSEAAANVGGPGLGGLLAQLLGAVTALLADAASFAVSAGCLAAIRMPTAARRPAGRSGPLRREIAAGLRFVRHDPYLRVMAVAGAASNLALTGYQSILVVFLVRVVGVSPGGVGALFAAMSTGGVLGAAVAGPLARRVGSARAMLVCALAGPPFGLLIPLAAAGPRLAFAVGGGIAVGASVVAGNVIKGSFRQAYCPAGLLGRVLVSMQLLNFGAIPVGALLGGTLGAAVGIRPTMWIMTGAVAVAGVIMLAGPMRHRRDLPDRPR